jgi:hypothetical protein
MEMTQCERMNYTKTYSYLKTLFDPDLPQIHIPDTGMNIFNTAFESDIPPAGLINKHDLQVSENKSFSYPVFTPPDKNSDKVILLLHGLNERSWIKYLSWAYYLAKSTNSYVILFPISFHINRSPSSWKDPRAMINFVKERNSLLGEAGMLSFVNVALSNRLTEDPMRFFRSGYQTSEDIVKLLTCIKNGTHPVIPKTGRFNIFAYSIGAFLAQILMMGNPAGLFSESKLFIFCGGSVFSNMQGSSKLIMDTYAFNKVYNYYMNDFEGAITGKSPLVDFLCSSQIGMAFRSMIDTARFKTLRENILNNLKGQIHSLSLIKDSVIPAKGIISTLRIPKLKNTVDIWDFPYNHSHENPFPVFDSPLSKKVDYWFEKVFAEAALFLAMD